MIDIKLCSLRMKRNLLASVTVYAVHSGPIEWKIMMKVRMNIYSGRLLFSIVLGTTVST